MTQARQQVVRLLDFKWIKLKTFSAESIHSIEIKIFSQTHPNIFLDFITTENN